VRTIQLWNEPSSGSRWAPKPDGHEYAELVKLGSSAIRSVDPEINIALAGLFSSPRGGGVKGIPARPFIRQLYSHPSFKSQYDLFAFHPYASNVSRLKEQLQIVRRTLAKVGDRRRGLIVSEVGWASKGPKGPLVKSPAEQARLLKAAFRVLKRKRSAWHIQQVDWFSWQDDDSRDVCDFCRAAGLYKAGRTPKPALNAYKQISGAR
jgi:hypothetical protein